MICLNVQGFLKHKNEIEVDNIAPCLAGFTKTHVTQEIEDHELYMVMPVCEVTRKQVEQVVYC